MRAVVVLALFVVGCQYTSPTTPGTAGLEVSAILNPSLGTQTLLLESIHDGSAVIDTIPYDPTNPIGTTYGLPVTGATVRIADTLGDAVTAMPTAPGVYQFAFPIVPGRRYTLRVTTADGRVVTGETTVPLANPVSLVASIPDSFDLATGSVTLHWPRVTDSRYVLTVGSPLDVYSAFLSDTSVTVTGRLLDPNHNLALVFWPGFVQTMSVSAIDSNYYDQYRSYLSGDATHRSHLLGGYGLFGSVVIQAIQTVHVTATAPQQWTLASSATGFPSRLLFYLAAMHPGDTSLSGRYQFAGDTTTRGMLGRLGKDSVYVDLLPDWVGADTTARFAGTIAGSSMTLRSMRNGATATYKK
ncbi:MAG TPA: DUF4249 family protein [Gemmatimonadaceae bacterium]|nr:DUF4249 family protein [Gemmatimonadaceae bacterium]